MKYHHHREHDDEGGDGPKSRPEIGFRLDDPLCQLILSSGVPRRARRDSDRRFLGTSATSYYMPIRTHGGADFSRGRARSPPSAGAPHLTDSVRLLPCARSGRGEPADQQVEVGERGADHHRLRACVKGRAQVGRRGNAALADREGAAACACADQLEGRQRNPAGLLGIAAQASWRRLRRRRQRA